MSNVETAVFASVAMVALLAYLLVLAWVQFRLVNPVTLRNSSPGKRWRLAILLAVLQALPVVVFVPLCVFAMLAYLSLKSVSTEGGGVFLLILFGFCLAFAVPYFLFGLLIERLIMWRELRVYSLWEQWSRDPSLEINVWWAGPSWYTRWWIQLWGATWRVMWPVLYPGSETNPFAVNTSDKL